MTMHVSEVFLWKAGLTHIEADYHDIIIGKPFHFRIDENNVIKVGDFGLSERLYGSGYFCQSKEEAMAREEKIPIRWMAPESIETGRYSEKTDVVST